MTAPPFDADIAACAGLVQRGDPQRFRAIMAAPVAARAVLFPLFAFNLEVARAPWVTQESMIAEMRLQWWRDAVEEIGGDGPVRRHEVVTPLSRVLVPQNIPDVDALIAMRRWDIYRDPFEDQEHFDRYIAATSGGLYAAAARALGAGTDTAARDFGWAAGVANWFLAIPELEAQKRIPLVDGSLDGVQALARRALDRLSAARSGRGTVPAAAVLPGWLTGRVLQRAVDDPRRVADGALLPSQPVQSLSLIWQASTGRW